MSARLPYVHPAQLAPEDRPLAPEQSHIFRTFANSIAGLRRYRGLTTFIRQESQLDPRLRELALCQIGYAAGGVYEYTHHVKSALAVGVTPEDLYALADETESIDTSLEPLVKAVLAATRQLTFGFDIDDATFAVLLGGLGEQGVMELLFSVATYVGTTKMLMALRVELEDEYQPYLERFPIRALRRS